MSDENEGLRITVPDWFLEELSKSNEERFRVPDEVVACKNLPPRQFIRVTGYQVLVDDNDIPNTSQTLETTEDWDSVFELFAREGQL